MKVLNRQSLLDIALQETGSVEQALSIAKLNNIPLTDDVDAGALLEVPVVDQNSVLKYYKLNEVMPASAISLDIPTGGINYMAVQIDFVVSKDK